MDSHVVGVAHTGITVRDLDASIAFWTDVLGFDLARRFELSGAFAENVTGVDDARLIAAVVEGSGHAIELLQYVSPTARGEFRPRPCDLGSLHVALTVDDLDTVVAEAARYGWQLAGTPDVMRSGSRVGTRFAYLHDPDGLTLELIQPPADSTSGAAPPSE